MKKLLFVLAAVTCLVAGYGTSKPKPTYDMVMGNKSVTLPVHEDAILIQNDIVSNVKPLWDNLQSGNSVAFHCIRTTPFHLGEDVEKKAKDKFGENATLTSSSTVTTPSLRFFKNRDGTNGMEQVDSVRGDPGLVYGQSVDWESIEHYLRSEKFSVQKIRWLIQNDLSEQTDAPDTK
jgi:hypothetical protein